MSKKIQISIIILVILALLFNCNLSYATDDTEVPLDDQQETVETPSDETAPENSELPVENLIENFNEDNTFLEDSEDVFFEDEIDQSILPASSVSSIEEEGLTFSSILSILLITVGIILILLAIAIILRLK